MSVSTFGNLRIYRLFAAPRSLSQLITSFIGSWCQGIRLMLLFAWTFLSVILSNYLVLFVLLELLEFHKTFFRLFPLCSLKTFFPFVHWFHFFHLSVKLYFFTLLFNRKTYTNLLIFVLFVCSFFLLFNLFSFIRFSMIMFAYQLFVGMVGTSGLEPPTSRLSGARSNHLSYAPLWLFSRFPSCTFGGDDGNRTHDPLLAGQVLSQLSYTPIGLGLFIQFPIGHWKLNNK